MAQPRVAIYARHSTEKQNPLLSEDQAAASQDVVARLGGTLVGTYADPKISGYRRDRPGLKQMLADAGDGSIDIIVCEALDRIARDGEDIGWLGKKLRYERVRLFTSVEGETDEIRLAAAAKLGSMFLSNLRHKTQRGMKAAVLAGRLAGGRAYGYRKVEAPDGTAGMMEIVPAEAETVRWILREFAGGRSSVSIAILAALQTRLLTADMAKLFVTEFQRELARLSKTSGEADREAGRRLKAIDVELAALSENLLACVVGPTIMSMISAREAEREALAARAKPIKADVIAHPALLRRFEEKIGRLREALSDEAVRGEVVATIRGLVDSVTMHADPVDGAASADLAASTGKLLRYAQKTENPRRASGRGCSVDLVAGRRLNRDRQLLAACI